jgi:hypothetical protein
MDDALFLLLEAFLLACFGCFRCFSWCFRHTFLFVP